MTWFLFWERGLDILHLQSSISLFSTWICSYKKYLLIRFNYILATTAKLNFVDKSECEQVNKSYDDSEKRQNDEQSR